AQVAHRQTLLAREAVGVGPAQRAPQDAAYAVVVLGRRGHAAPVLGPLVLDQPGHGRHAQVAADEFGRRARSESTPLRRRTAARLGPEPVEDEAEAAMRARALHRPLVLRAPAVFGRPTRRQGIAADRRPPR